MTRSKVPQEAFCALLFPLHFARGLLIILIFLAIVCPPTAVAAERALPAHAVTTHGEPKYPPDFRYFDYVNPSAPKGGEVRLSHVGTFDSFNPYIIKGQPFTMVGGLVFETLMVGAHDDPTSAYGLIAESVEIPSDRSWVAFNLRPQAHWHDNEPITADDIVWTFETLRSRGLPHYRSYYADVIQAVKENDQRVRFVFKPGVVNHELPLILGQLPVLPRHYWAMRRFDEASLEVPLGSGPYRIESFEAGRYILLRRNPTYWGRDLPVNRGLYNFDTIRVDYYRDFTVSLEAFRGGAYDFRIENSAKAWTASYSFPAVETGRVIKEEMQHQRPQGMQAFAFNIRRPLFQDPRVRQALAYAFDFEWANRNLFYSQYERSNSYFSNSSLAGSGLPGPQELQILEPLRNRLPQEVLTRVYAPPTTDGSGNNRDNLQTAIRLLKESRWTIQNQALIHEQTGEPFMFELLLDDQIWERVAAPFAHNLKRLGITMQVRIVDPTVYEKRVQAFDFDMLVYHWPQSQSPGNEQRDYWGSAAADTKGSNNIIGIREPIIDWLIEMLIAAPDHESLVARTRALDRVLLWSHFVVPHWYVGYDRVAYWRKLKHPAIVPSNHLWTWWIDDAS
ncbi:ABC transporter, periplasmic substrate-binding protein [invertebrate metagenome]|uniref:ABC transporter, periplasmic substrate-binding protein n=1 Tax=invertebrate metagenome TaxID=1711999 RepID=A0A484H549_9ZZZZ